MISAWGAGVLVRAVFLAFVILGVVIAYQSIKGKQEHLKRCREYKRST